MRSVFSRVLALLMLCSCKPAPDAVVEGLEGARFSDARGAMMYRYYAPTSATKEQPLPLVVYLHSNGRQGDDNFKHIDFRVTRWVVNQKEHPCFVLAPQLPAGRWVDAEPLQGNYAFDDAKITASMQQLIALIEQMATRYPVDRSRIYVLGTSLGGFGTWDLLARKPDLVAAAVPIEGGGDPAQAARFANVPIWAFHGAKDTQVPVDATRKMIEAVRAAGGSPLYTEYPDVDHESPKRVFEPETRLDQWLFAQQRK